MQQFAARPNPTSPGSSRTQKIVIVAITLFALSGLMVGFVVGAATRPHKQLTNAPTQQPTAPITQQTGKTPTSTSKPQVNVAANGIGCPKVQLDQADQNADNSTDYTVKALIADKSISKEPAPCGTGKPIKASGLTCKIWLTDNLDSLHHLTKDQFNPASNLQNPFPKEVQNAFIFDNNQQQVQPCNQTGTTSWSYKLSPNLKAGTYQLAVAADYNGLVFNWAWTTITIQSTKNN